MNASRCALVARLIVAATVQYEGGFDAFPVAQCFYLLRILLHNVQNRIIGGALLVSERKIQTVRFALHLMGAHIFHDALNQKEPDILAARANTSVW